MSSARSLRAQASQPPRRMRRGSGAATHLGAVLRPRLSTTVLRRNLGSSKTAAKRSSISTRALACAAGRREFVSGVPSSLSVTSSCRALRHSCRVARAAPSESAQNAGRCAPQQSVGRSGQGPQQPRRGCQSPFLSSWCSATRRHNKAQRATGGDLWCGVGGGGTAGGPRRPAPPCPAGAGLLLTTRRSIEAVRSCP